MKIVADRHIYNVEKAFANFGEIVLLSGRLITPGLELLKDADILLVRSITKVNADLLSGTRVKFVASASVGVDHIDLDYLRENCIGFAHTPGANACSVAEYVMAALLEIGAKSKRKISDLTLGIIGVGNVGSCVHRFAAANKMTCVLNDPPKKELTGNFIYRPLEEVLEKSDIITLHVPLLESTNHLVNAEFLSRMKEGATLINASRGQVVCEKSLFKTRARLGAVVLDVFENEPAINIETIRIADIATPHIAGYSVNGKSRGIEMMRKSAAAFFFKDAHNIILDDSKPKQTQTIDLRASENPVYDCVKSAYSIMRDDEKLRGIYSVPEENRAKFFDDLRANYPKRLEFEHFSAILAPHQKAAAEILKELRFSQLTKTAGTVF